MQLSLKDVSYKLERYDEQAASVSLIYSVIGTDLSCSVLIDLPLSENPQPPTESELHQLFKRQAPLGQLQWMLNRRRLAAQLDPTPLFQLVQKGVSGVCGEDS